MNSKTHRISRACENCNKRKIRCKPQPFGACEACIEHELTCVPRTRKKRQIAVTQPANGYEAPTPRQPVGQPERRPELIPSPVRHIRLRSQTENILSPEVSGVIRTKSLSEGSNWYEDTINRLASPKDTPITPELESHRVEVREVPELIAHDDEINEVSADVAPGSMGDIDHQILQLRNSYQLPPRAIRESLNDAFMERCYPWTPIIERSWLDDEIGRPISLLLIQAVFLAASRVSSSPSVAGYATPRDFYQRAKALFWTGHERDALMTIRAACILNWFNPHGPEQVSFDTSRFWNHIAVGLAHQINLHKEPPPGRKGSMRRRLWWSLVVRDSLLSASHGRPRALNLDDCDVRPPSVEDFQESPLEGQLFIRYVEVCTLLGDITECYSRKQMSRHHRYRVLETMSRWTMELPEELQLFQRSADSMGLLISPYNFKARQLHIPYFVILTIMHKTLTPNAGPSAVSILAASYIAGIFEDFLARDEVQYLPAIFTFYGLSAGVSLISFHRYPHLRKAAEQDLAVIMTAESELAKRWPTARGMRAALENMMSSIPKADARSIQLPLDVPKSEIHSYFSAFGPRLCRMRHVVLGQTAPWESNESQDLEIMQYHNMPAMPILNMGMVNQESFPLATESGYQGELGQGIFDFQHDDMGLWLFDNGGADFPIQ